MLLQASGARAALDPQLFVQVTGADCAPPPGLSPSPSINNSAAADADADADVSPGSEAASGWLPPPGLSSAPSSPAAAPASASTEALCPVAESAAVGDWDATAAQLAPPATRPKTNVTVARRHIFAGLGRSRELPRGDAAELELKAAQEEKKAKAAARRRQETASAEAAPCEQLHDATRPALVRLCCAWDSVPPPLCRQQ